MCSVLAFNKPSDWATLFYIFLTVTQATHPHKRILNCVFASRETHGWYLSLFSGLPSAEIMNNARSKTLIVITERWDLSRVKAVRRRKLATSECFLRLWVWFYILWGMEATECLLFLCDCCVADCAVAEWKTVSNILTLRSFALSCDSHISFRCLSFFI